MDENLRALVVTTVKVIPLCCAHFAPFIVNYTLLQFTAAIAINSVFVLSKASAVVFKVFYIVFTEHKQRRDPLAALIFLCFIWAFIMHISWSLKSVHSALSVVWSFLLDCKYYYTSYFRQDALPQREVGAQAEQMQNGTTILIVKKIQTREGQAEVERPVIQPRNENVYIKEVTYDTQKMGKKTSALRLRKPNLELKKKVQQETKNIEKKEQFKVKAQNLKHELAEVNNEQTKFNKYVKQHKLYTVQQKLKDDHQELSKNQKQLKIAPEEKACNTSLMDMNGLSKKHNLGVLPITRLHNVNLNENYELKKKMEEPHKQINPSVEQLQREGQLCKMNCVALAIRWICKNKTGIKISGCACQLVTIITAYAVENGKRIKQDLGCGHFMERLVCLGIVKLPDDNQYVFGHKMNKETVIKKAWNNLMTMDEKVCILGTRNLWGGGHVVVCDLDTRTSKTTDGKAMFYDPQARTSDGKENLMSLKDFLVYVIDCDGLRLYPVSLEELNNIVISHKDLLHDTQESTRNDSVSCRAESNR